MVSKSICELDHISPVETGLAKAYMTKGNNKLAYKYAREAIKQPYAPAFVVIADLTDNKIAKYAYLAEAVELYKNPALKFWSQFNEYCMPDILIMVLNKHNRNYLKLNYQSKS